MELLSAVTFFLLLIFSGLFFGFLGELALKLLRQTDSGRAMKHLEGAIYASTVIFGLLASIRGAIWINDSQNLISQIFYQNLLLIMNLAVVAVVIFGIWRIATWNAEINLDTEKAKNDETLAEEGNKEINSQVRIPEKPIAYHPVKIDDKEPPTYRLIPEYKSEEQGK